MLIIINPKNAKAVSLIVIQVLIKFKWDNTASTSFQFKKRIIKIVLLRKKVIRYTNENLRLFEVKLIKGAR